MSGATIWSRTKNSVTTDAVESRMVQFLPVLMMTRDSVKFPKWTSGTVEKAFKWADYLYEVSQFADAVQKKAIMHKVDNFMNTGVSEITGNPMLVFEDPISILVHAIISSPYLSWMKDSAQVLKKTYQCVSERKTEEASVKVFVDALKGTLDSRISFRGIWSSHRYDCAPDTVLNTDEESLAFELLVGFHSVLKLSVVEREGQLRTLARAAEEDPITFRMLCVTLALSPAKIACLREIFLQNSSNSNTHMPSLEVLCKLSKSRDLVDIVASTIRESFPRFLSIDDNQGSLCSLLCKQDDIGDEFVALFSELQGCAS